MTPTSSADEADRSDAISIAATDVATLVGNDRLDDAEAQPPMPTERPNTHSQQPDEEDDGDLTHDYQHAADDLSPPYPPPPSYHATVRGRDRDGDSASVVTHSSTSTLRPLPRQRSAPPMLPYSDDEELEEALFESRVVQATTEQDLTIPWWSAILPSPSLNRSTRSSRIALSAQQHSQQQQESPLRRPRLPSLSSSPRASPSPSSRAATYSSGFPSLPTGLLRRSLSVPRFTGQRSAGLSADTNTETAQDSVSASISSPGALSSAAPMTPVRFPDPPALPQPYGLYTKCYCEENAYILAAYLERVCRLRNSGVETAAEPPQWQWDVDVCFVSNADKSVALWQQRASQTPDTDHIVIWDYHVFVIVTCRQLSTDAIGQESNGTTSPASRSMRTGPAFLPRRRDSLPASGQPALPSKSWVYDLDTRLRVPCSLSSYLRSTFRANQRESISPQFRPTFRIVSASNYLLHFASDRSHMRIPITAEEEDVERALSASIGDRVTGDQMYRWSSPPPSWPLVCGPLADSSNKLMDIYVDMTSRRTASDDNRHGIVVRLDELMQGVRAESERFRSGWFNLWQTPRRRGRDDDLQLSEGIARMIERFDCSSRPLASPSSSLTASSSEPSMGSRGGHSSRRNRSSNETNGRALSRRETHAGTGSRTSSALRSRDADDEQEQHGFVIGVRRVYGRRPPPPVPGRDRFAHLDFSGRGKRVSSPLFPAYMNATLQSRAASTTRPESHLQTSAAIS